MSNPNLMLMRVIDEECTRHPFYGVERTTAYLGRHGYNVKASNMCANVKWGNPFGISSGDTPRLQVSTIARTGVLVPRIIGSPS